ncbi:MAG: PAS domain S-box protein [Actinomycetota bacterium]
METKIESNLPFLEIDLLRSAFEYASIGMALINPDGKCLAVNNSISQITGYSKEELLQMTFGDITHPDDVEKDRFLSRQLLDGKDDTFEMEKRYFHKKGHLVWVLLTVSVVRNETGEPLYLIGQVKDISERKRIETKLKQRKRELNSVLNNTQTVIVRLNRECRHLYINSAIEKEIGIPSSVIIGKTFAELNIADLTSAKIEETVRLVFETKQEQEIEFSNTIRREVRYYYAYFTPEFDENGEVETVSAVSLNVTKLKTSEINLRKALAEIKRLKEILPICSYCKNIRDDQDYWQTLERYITTHTHTQFSHGICPNCYDKIVKPKLIERGIETTDDKKKKPD